MPQTRTTKKFIKDTLIPFILRDNGEGFAMDDWIISLNPYRNSGITRLHLDGLARDIPKCDTICCIGGSIQTLCYSRDADVGNKELGQRIGLTTKEAHGLFYYWWYDEENKNKEAFGWPKVYADKYKKAATPLQKAQVACALLHEIAEKGGKVLHRQ